MKFIAFLFTSVFFIQIQGYIEVSRTPQGIKEWGVFLTLFVLCFITVKLCFSKKKITDN